MSDILFTSDDHIDHPYVYEMRGFASAEEYREWYCDRWVSSVRKQDTVWNLGDICLSNLDDVLAMYKKLPGRKHLIWGNHDQGWPKHRKAYNAQKRYLEAFDSANAFQYLKTYGEEFILTHLPYTGEHKNADGTWAPDRYEQYRLPNMGLTNIHGHVHGEWLVRSEDELWDNKSPTLMINVGVDRWMHTMPTIADIMELKRGNIEID